MQISKKAAREKVKEAVLKIILDREKVREMVFGLHDRFGIATGDIMDYINGQNDIGKADPFMLFVLSYGIDDILDGSNLVNDIFTEVEIKQFSTYKVDARELYLPLRIKCIQVKEDQWIGASNVSFLMLLRDAQKINYNTNAQRAMKRVIRGGNEFYRIAINNSAVKKIRDSLERGIFIPNTITLNLPLDSDYRYNEKTNELVINDFKYFDIADGYHRFLAMSQIYSKDNTFDYPVELRIISFSDDTVKQFIFQEDQKTKMRKIDSESMNMDAAPNIVAERLNRDIMFNWHGQIARGGARVNMSDLAEMIRYFYYKPYNPRKIKKLDQKFIVETEAALVDILNPIIARNDKLMNETVSFKTLLVLFYCVSKYGDNSLEHIRKGLDHLDEIHTDREINARVIKEVSNLVD